MAVLISKLRGMPDELQAELQERGIRTSDQLLFIVRTPAAREELATCVGVAPSVVLDVANRADLARVKGVGGVFSDLLEHAGIDTVKELAQRSPDHLYAKLIETNAHKKLAGRAPTWNAVQNWVAQAKSLTPLLEY